MAGGYNHSPDGMAGFAAKIAGLQRQIDALRSAAGLTSAVIGKGGILVKDGGRVTTIDAATGAQTQFGQGRISLWQDAVSRPDAFGLIYSDPGAENNVFRIFPPHDSGTGLENSVTLQGRSATDPGNYWVYTDGELNLSGGTGTNLADGVRISLAASRIELYNIPSVASPSYQLGYNFDGTNWSVVFVTSSRRYKQDIEAADLDPDAVLGIRPVTFRDIASVEKSGVDAPVNFGVIAEELHDLGLGDLLVTYKDGEPDAVKYDRIGLALVPAIKRQAEQIADLTARLEALEARA